MKADDLMWPPDEGNNTKRRRRKTNLAYNPHYLSTLLSFFKDCTVFFRAAEASLL